MHHQRHSLRPLRTQNWHVYVLQSLYRAPQQNSNSLPQNSDNIHQIIRPKECREPLWQGGIILMHASVQNCLWNVQCAVHYCKFIWWIKLCITQLQRTICDQKCGLKLQFAYNQNKVKFWNKMSHFAYKISKVFRESTPESLLWEEAIPSSTYPKHGLRLHPSLTPPTFKYLPQSMLLVCKCYAVHSSHTS